MIEPVIEAFTTLVRPLESAIKAMISSAALPKVTLSNPPIAAPARAANASVARPIRPARGMIARAEQAKRAVSFAPGQKRSAIAIGTKISSQLSDGFKFTAVTS